LAEEEGDGYSWKAGVKKVGFVESDGWKAMWSYGRRFLNGGAMDGRP
jgi:hypothetical protein